MHFEHGRVSSHSAKNPFATPKDIATQMGKSEQTVKSIAIALQEKNILRRMNGKRNGYWEIMEDFLYLDSYLSYLTLSNKLRRTAKFMQAWLCSRS